MDLSIIIPCHNLEKFITPMLVSLNLQHISQDTEIIFVCDCCTDNTKNIIENFEFTAPYKKITIIECDCLSCGLARNLGLEAAEGNTIMFLDGDDWLTSYSSLSIAYNNLVNNNLRIMRFAYEAPGFYAIGHPSMVWQYIYTREIIGETRFTNIQPDEDLIFNQIIAAKVNGQIPYLPKKLYHYNYMRDGSNIQQFITKGIIEP